MRQLFIIFLYLALAQAVSAQVWQPDQGDGSYKNPVLYADYSDPDVIRVGNDYYLVASSFTCQPGIPVLHSKDLVNWTIINYVYDALPLPRYQQPQHGQGSWAPSIRYHNQTYYVYFCTPEDGLFMASTKDPAQPWTLTQVKQIKGWEDPCPFWDEDGQAYLLHGKVGAGPAILHKLAADGKTLLDEGTLIYQNASRQPVLEGFKFLDKRDGYYYFAAPAGGVGAGWQSVFRAKNIYGPYEDKIVLHQGRTTINGPHQGGLVQTQTGEWWFMHFQEKVAYGRIVHLQPATWKDGWPVIGQDDDGDGIGEPVLTHQKPNVGKTYSRAAPQTSDEFSSASLGLQWQWQAAPNKAWYALDGRAGTLRLQATPVPTDSGSLAYAGNLLLQKFTAPAFTATTKLALHAAAAGDRAGLAVVNGSYICLERKGSQQHISIYEQKKNGWNKLFPPTVAASLPTTATTVWLRVQVAADATCAYS
ncbi:MAG: glycosyl hydrolase 43 family protein, partial [Hymenobacter sp.]